jgi:CheY-like chemotaxis protein
MTKVLVVDDDDGVRTTACEILRGDGYEVSQAEDGEEALVVLEREDPEVLVLDVRMPRRDGISLLDALDRPPVVVLVSAFSLENDVRARLGDKVFRYLRKPVAPYLLLEVVAAAAARAASAG